MRDVAGINRVHLISSEHCMIDSQTDEVAPRGAHSGVVDNGLRDRWDFDDPCQTYDLQAALTIPTGSNRLIHHRRGEFTRPGQFLYVTLVFRKSGELLPVQAEVVRHGQTQVEASCIVNSLNVHRLPDD